MENTSFLSLIVDYLTQFFHYTAFANMTIGHIFMILIGLVFIYLAIVREYEPMLLVPMGFGMLIGNIASVPGLQIGINESGSIANFLYSGV